MRNPKILLLNLLLLLTISCEKEQLLMEEETVMNNFEKAYEMADLEEQNIPTCCLETKFKTIQLNGQTWLAENLNTAIKGSSCSGYTTKDCETNGRLYSFAAAKKACVSLGDGWRIPSRKDWDALIMANGGFGIEPNSAYQEMIDGGSSGFDALLMKLQFSNSVIPAKFGQQSVYWSGSNSSEGNGLFYATSYGFYSQIKAVVRNDTPKNIGLSCRCVKD